ncbi:MAG: hypothetical protein P8181_02465 [bacterium]
MVELPFEAPKVRRAADLGAVGKPEHEIPKAEVVFHERAQIVEQRRRVLEQERHAELIGQHFVRRIARLEQNRDVGMRGPDRLGKPDPRLRILGTRSRKLDIGDHAEYVLVEFFEVRPRFFVSAAQENLRPRPPPQEFVRRVDPFGDQALRVTHQLGIDDRKIRRIEPDAVLDEDDRLHADEVGVLLDIEPVFHEFDDGEQNPEVAAPDEHLVEIRHVVFGHQVVEGARVVGEQHDGNIFDASFRLARKIDRLHILQTQRRDDEVEPLLVGEHRKRIPAAGHTCDTGCIAEIQPHVFVQQGLVKTPILGQYERIVNARHEQDVADPVPDQILKTLEPGPVPVLEIVKIEILQRTVSSLQMTGVSPSCGNRCKTYGPAEAAGKTLSPTNIIENGVEIFHSVFNNRQVCGES